MKQPEQIITVIQVYAPISNAGEAKVERFYEDLQDLLELTPKKDVLFIIGDWNAKVGSQETLGVTGKFGVGIRNEAGQRLIVFPRKCTGHSKHPLPTTQEKTLNQVSLLEVFSRITHKIQKPGIVQMSIYWTDKPVWYFQAMKYTIQQ